WTGDAPLIVHNAVLWASGIPTFVGFSPSVGAIPPGGSAQVQVTFDATHVFGGDYRADVVVQSNDPDQPEAVVQASLHFTGAPDLAVVPASLEFGQVFLGGARPETLRVTNQGSQLLRISGVSITPAAFTAPTAAFDLGPGERRDLIVTYTPPSPAPSAGSL